MSAESYLLSVVHDQRNGLLASVLRFILAVLAWVYVGGLKAYLLPYRLGIRKQFRLPVPVISIGNITTGGTGKSTMTRWVCERLQQLGHRPCVLIRGHRGTAEHSELIVSDGKRVLSTVEQSGDEADMLARQLKGVPVVAGKDRRKTGMLAMQEFNPTVFVLDDGMQFYQLHRDLDIALVDCTNPFDNGWTFPRGLLREPPSHLRRCSLIVLTHPDKVNGETLDQLKSTVSRLARSAMGAQAAYSVTCISALDRSFEVEPTWLQGKRVATFCALGNPEAFERQVMQKGADICLSKRYPDHHAVSLEELNAFIEAAVEQGAEAVIVSEKDAVKLPPIGRPIPFAALKAELVVSTEQDVIGLIQKILGSWQAAPTRDSQ